jgi:thiamine biosynthesis lipoprotein
MTAVRVRIRWLAMACAGPAIVACTSPAAPTRAVAGVAQGTTYSLQWIGGSAEPEMAAAAARELARIDALLSNYRADSTLEVLNTTRSVEPIELPAELVALLELAKSVHAASDGCFDPTVRALVRAWGFDGDAPEVPTPAAVANARAVVGLDKLELLDSTHVRKTVPGLEVDMASIGQGYTVGRLADVLELQGSTAYLAEIGGEIVARGTKPGGTSWRIGLENPVDDARAGPRLAVPFDARTAVVTSGSYRHYLDAGGRRLGHIIDPRSGEPVDHALLSVTVVGSDAATAAAWGTALLCLGPVAGVAAADREGLAALFWVGQQDAPATVELSPAFEAGWRERLDDPMVRPR